MANVLAMFSSSGVVQGIIIGATLAFLTAILIMNAVGRAITTTVNGWSAIRKCGQPGNGILVRAACAKALPVVNVFEEAAYWTTTMDGSGQTLGGGHGYVLHLPAGKLPPNDAFWSLTATDVVGYMVSNPTNRYSVGDRSRAERRRFSRYLSPASGSGRARGELAANSFLEVQADVPRVSAWRGNSRRHVPIAARCQGAVI